MHLQPLFFSRNFAINKTTSYIACIHFIFLDTKHNKFHKKWQRRKVAHKLRHSAAKVIKDLCVFLTQNAPKCLWWKYRVAQKSGTYMLYVDICLILVLSLYITEEGATKTKQMTFFAISLMLKFRLNILCDVMMYLLNTFTAPFAKNCRLSAYSCTRLHWTWKLASQYLGLESGGLLHYGVLYSSLLIDSRFETLSTWRTFW